MKVVQVRGHVPAPPRRVIEAFTSERDLVAWWGAQRALVDGRRDGVWCCCWNPSPDEPGFSALSGIVLELDPDAEVRIGKLLHVSRAREILGPMSLRIRASAEHDGSHVEISQDGYGAGDDWDWYYSVVSQQWPRNLQRLTNYLRASETSGA